MQFSASSSPSTKIPIRQRGRNHTRTSRCDERRLRIDGDSTPSPNARRATSEQQQHCHSPLEACPRSFADRRLTELIRQKYAGTALPKLGTPATTLKASSKEEQRASRSMHKQHRRDTRRPGGVTINRTFAGDIVTVSFRADVLHDSSPAGLNFEASNRSLESKGAIMTRSKSMNKEPNRSSRRHIGLKPNDVGERHEKACSPPTLGEAEGLNIRASNHSTTHTCRRSSQRYGCSVSKLKSNDRQDRTEKSCSVPTLREALGLGHVRIEREHDDIRRNAQSEGGRSPSQKAKDTHKGPSWAPAPGTAYKEHRPKTTTCTVD
jgi:hypothetical protein